MTSSYAPPPDGRPDEGGVTVSASRNLKLEYDAMRQELEDQMSAPVKNFPRIDELIGRLELVQLAIKDEDGIKGNNPNE